MKDGKIKVALPQLFGNDAPRYLHDVVANGCSEAAKFYNAVAKIRKKLDLLVEQKSSQRFPKSLQIKQPLFINKTTIEEFPEITSHLEADFQKNVLEYQEKQLEIFIQIKRLDLQRAENILNNTIPRLLKQLLEVFQPLFLELRGNNDEDNDACSFSEFAEYILNSWKSRGKRSAAVLKMTTELSNLAEWMFQIPTIVEEHSEQHHLESLLQSGYKRLSSKITQEKLDKAEEIELELPTNEKVVQLVDMRISKKLKKLQLQIKKLDSNSKKSTKNPLKNVPGNSNKSSGNAEKTSNKRQSPNGPKNAKTKGKAMGNPRKNSGKRHNKNSGKSPTKEGSEEKKKASPKSRKRQKGSN